MVINNQSPNKKCPPQSALESLLLNRETNDSQEVSEHLSECGNCTEKLESIALADAKHLSTTVRGLKQSEPPVKSAYWAAMHAVEDEITKEFTNTPVDDNPSKFSFRTGQDSGDLDLEDKVDLSFLKPSPVPGKIGRLGDFEIVRVIGKGGMGIVLHAFDPHLQRDVAIKILDPHLATNNTARQRFCREARSAAAVTHDNLVTIYQVDEDQKSGLPYLVMQLVSGESLDKKLARMGQLSIQEVVRLGVQTAAGLAAAHSSGLIHRDIKPGNILIEKDTEKAILTDFGLARANEDLKLTKTGMVAGTPLYMAPEQANGLESDHRADLFSLGSVLYEALAGRPAFDARTPLAVLRRISDENHVPLRKINPDVPDWLNDVVEGLLKKNPNARIATASQVVEKLAAHASCTIPSLEGKPGNCDTVKVASQALKSNKPLQKLAYGVLAASIIAGSILGSLATYFFMPGKEKIVEKRVEVASATSTALSNNSMSGPEPLLTLSSINGSVNAATPSIDGKFLATAYESGRIQIWDLATGKTEKSFEGHKGAIWSMSYSNDNSSLITASDDGTVKVWDSKKYQSIKNIDHPNGVRSAVLQEGGKLIISGDRNGLINVMNINDEAFSVQFKHGSAVNAVAISPDGLGIASAGSDGKIILWDIPGTKADEHKRLELNAGHRGPVYTVAFSQDGNYVASGGWDGQVVIWDVKSGAIVKQFSAHKNGVLTLDFSSCCNFIATGGEDHLVKIWDIKTISNNKDDVDLRATFSRHQGTVRSVHFFNQAPKLVSSSQDGSAMIWDLTAFCPTKPMPVK